TLKLFRDELGGGATMPLSVSIGIFNGNQQYPAAGQGYLVNKTREDGVPVNPFPACVVNADPISYHVGIYELNIDLPDSPNGYTATFQTCCRVMPLENADNSLSVGTGSTYTCYIPPVTDSSPDFSTNVGLICRNRNFTLDFSAKDADTDSLVYSFCNAYDGGLATGAGPINPEPPPYNSVIYFNGNTKTTPLGPSVTIDPKTGIISGKAPGEGKYVVAVCVKSYRNGVLVGEHYKDFIVKIGDCDFASAQLLPKPVSCEGFTVNFSNDNQSPLNQTYFWDFGVPSLSNDTSNLPNPSFTYPDTGVYVYKLVINRNKPCGDSMSQTIKVYPGFYPGFTWTGQCVNAPVKFIDTTATTYGNVSNWSWDFGDPATLADTSDARNPVHAFPGPGNAIVRLIVSNSKGCKDSVSVPVNIISNPVVTNTFHDTTYCGKDTLQLHAYSSVNGTYSWSPATNLLNGNTADPLVFPSIATKYAVTLDAGGCTATDTIRLNPLFDLTTSITPSGTNICEEDTISLTAVTNHNPAIFTWSPASSLSSTSSLFTKAFPVNTTTYTLNTRWGKNCTATAASTVNVKKLAIPNAGSDTSFCAGSSGVMLNASGGNDYIWKPAAGLNNPGIANPIANPQSPTLYSVSVGTAGCIKRREDTVLVIPRMLPAIILTNDTLICSIDTLQLNATSVAGNKFLWYPVYNINSQDVSSVKVSPKVPTTYYVQVTDGNKCVNTDSVFVDVKQFVTIDAGNDTTICQGDAVKINVISDALAYKWTPAATLDNDASVSPTATPLNTTTYTVAGIIGKCQSTDAVIVKVVPYPKANAGRDQSICFNGSAQLTATGGSKYTWVPIAGLSRSDIPDPIATPANTVTYTVTVTDTVGCPKPASDDVVITIFPPINADAGPPDTSIVENQPLQLHGTGGISYLWMPATGLSNPNIADPVAKIGSDQRYILKVTNAGGCAGNDSISIKVYRLDAGLYVPNAFTPNGDNLNDIFNAVPLGMKSLNYFRIYNRFGEVVFSTNQLNKGWNGTLNGKPQNPDVYVWIIEGTDYQDTKIFKRGIVTLIR
ncbi:MAG: PKD domain-containing protein, partial [Ginsengibacter sp.]